MDLNETIEALNAECTRRGVDNYAGECVSWTSALLQVAAGDSVREAVASAYGLGSDVAP